MKKILITNYYISNDEKRRSEYHHCINTNVNSGLFDEVLMMSKPNVRYKDDMGKIIYYNQESRPTFKNLIEICNDRYEKGVVCVLSNLDIIFDETINLVDNIDLSKTFLALSRYDRVQNGWGMMIPASKCSQDTWIFTPKIDTDKIYCDFQMGKPGCDNRIAHEFDANGYKTYNPSLDIKTYHVHQSNVRTYKRTPNETVPPPYKTLIPTKL